MRATYLRRVNSFLRLDAWSRYFLVLLCVSPYYFPSVHATSWSKVVSVHTASCGYGGLTRGRHLGDVYVLLVGHEAQDGEDGEAGDEAGPAVQEAQGQAVSGNRKHASEEVKD